MAACKAHTFAFYFNPLNPRGLRRGVFIWKSTGTPKFQSTQPKRVETEDSNKFIRSPIFQSTQPKRVETGIVFAVEGSFRNFNPLNPRGLFIESYFTSNALFEISIHSTQEG